MYHHVILKYSTNYFQTFHCSPSSTTPSPGLAGTWLLLGKVIICCCCYCCWVCCFLCCCFVAWIFWSGWDVTTPANFKQDYNAFSSNQKSEFLLTLIKVGLSDSEIEEMWFFIFLFESQNEKISILLLKDGLSHEKLEAMAKMYKMEDCSNVEVNVFWG